MTGPKKIGKYTISETIGAGAMGVVYQGFDPNIRRSVAIKTMTETTLQQEEHKARFLREAQSAGQLRHRNIVTIYELGEEAGQPFIVMELLEGTDLDRIIGRERELSLAQRMDVIIQVLRGLSFAHRSGIVHRDVKPANIHLLDDGVVKIVDFGIARLSSSEITRTGTVLGTVSYMSPEQISGEKVDARSDIFSVGIILHELLTRKRPFSGESITERMYSIVHQPPQIEPRFPRGAPPALEQVIRKALEKNPEDRFQSADEMADTLESIVRDLTTPEPDRSSKEELQSSGKHNRHLFLIVGTGAAVITLVVIFLALGVSGLIPIFNGGEKNGGSGPVEAAVRPPGGGGSLKGAGKTEQPPALKKILPDVSTEGDAGLETRTPAGMDAGHTVSSPGAGVESVTSRAAQGEPQTSPRARPQDIPQDTPQITPQDDLPHETASAPGEEKPPRDRSLPSAEEIQRNPAAFARRFFNEGMEAYQRRQYEVAIRKLEQSLELDPENAKAFPFLVAALFDSGDTDGARRRYHDGLNRFPFLRVNPRMAAYKMKLDR